MQYCFGVDIGGTTVKMGLFEKNGTVVDKWEIETRTENQGEAILSDVAIALAERQKKWKLENRDVLGVGIGIPAPVNEEGIVLNTANLGWGYKEVNKEMHELTGMRIESANDANVAALGEMWLGAGKGHKNMIMVTLGTGVGGGVIVNGKAIVGAHGAGGEIGHICVNYEETDFCGCGKKGCLEQYSSATGITRLANRRLEDGKGKSILRDKTVNAKEVFDAVKAGDAVAIEIAEEFGRYLGYAMANLATIVDPAVIVIGGGVSRAGEVLLGYIQKYFRQKAFFANRETSFVLAELGNDAGICGAASLIIM